MRPCLKCGDNIPSKAMVNGKKRNLFYRKKCLKCLPFGAPSYSPNRIIPERRIQNNLVVTHYRQTMKLRGMEFLGGKCWVCGYSRCRAAMVFHHIDPMMKKFGIADGRTRGWSILVEELKKCALLCNRCHEEIHAGIVDLNDYAKLREEDSNPP